MVAPTPTAVMLPVLPAAVTASGIMRSVLFPLFIVKFLSFLGQVQHELPLGQLSAGLLGFLLQVGLDPLEELLGDMEGRRSRIAAHSRRTSIFLQIVVFDRKVRDVFAVVWPVASGLADLRVEGGGDLSAEVLFLFHAANLRPVCRNESITEKH